jgi:hypothetical protein
MSGPLPWIIGGIIGGILQGMPPPPPPAYYYAPPSRTYSAAPANPPVAPSAPAGISDEQYREGLALKQSMLVFCARHPDESFCQQLAAYQRRWPE